MICLKHIISVIFYWWWFNSFWFFVMPDPLTFYLNNMHMNDVNRNVNCKFGHYLAKWNVDYCSNKYKIKILKTVSNSFVNMWQIQCIHINFHLNLCIMKRIVLRNHTFSVELMSPEQSKNRISCWRHWHKIIFMAKSPYLRHMCQKQK